MGEEANVLTLTSSPGADPTGSGSLRRELLELCMKHI
jgi:hypothetical protein